MNKPWQVLFAWCCVGISPWLLTAAEPATGWRGNGTGLWPQSKAPLEWGRIAHGALEGMRCQASRPAADAKVDAVPLVQKGLPGEWLLLGPLPVQHSVENFDDDL